MNVGKTDENTFKASEPSKSTEVKVTLGQKAYNFIMDPLQYTGLAKWISLITTIGLGVLSAGMVQLTTYFVGRAIGTKSETENVTQKKIAVIFKKFAGRFRKDGSS